jgi:hypothetical protein
MREDEVSCGYGLLVCCVCVVGVCAAVCLLGKR